MLSLFHRNGSDAATVSSPPSPMYKLQSSSVLKTLGHFAVDYIRRTQKHWKWLLSIGLCQIVSAYTNVAGMRLFLPLALALLAGVGLQCMALYVGAHVLHGQSDEGESSWPGTLVLIIGLSAFFSYLGFISTYQRQVNSVTRPMLEHQDLQRQAKDLSENVTGVKALVQEKLSNRITYARSLIARIESQQAQNQYPNPTAAQNMIAVQRALISEAQVSQREWRSFTFSAQDALSQPTVEAGFAKLQQVFNQLGSMTGTLGKAELGNYTLPDAPVSSVAEPVGGAEQVNQAFLALFSLTGLFVLCLALMLEAAPFAIARFVSSDSPPLSGSNESLFLPQQEIPSRGAGDQGLIGELTMLNNRVRVLHFVGPDGPREVELQIMRTEPLVEAFRHGFVEREWGALTDFYIDHRLELRRRNLERLVAEGRMRGCSDEKLSPYIEADFAAVVKEFEREGVRIEGLAADDHVALVRSARQSA